MVIADAARPVRTVSLRGFIIKTVRVHVPEGVEPLPEGRGAAVAGTAAERFLAVAHPDDIDLFKLFLRCFPSGSSATNMYLLLEKRTPLLSFVGRKKVTKESPAQTPLGLSCRFSLFPPPGLRTIHPWNILARDTSCAAAQWAF